MRKRQRPYFVIESTNRGVFVEWRNNGKPRFQWAKARSESKHFHSWAAVTKEFARIRPHVKGNLYAFEMNGRGQIEVPV